MSFSERGLSENINLLKLMIDIVDQKDVIYYEKMKNKKKWKNIAMIICFQYTMIILSGLVLVFFGYWEMYNYLFKIDLISYIILYATICLGIILYGSYVSLKHEINSIIRIDVLENCIMRERNKISNNNIRKSLMTKNPIGYDAEILTKLYDVNKNPIDKLFDKVKSFGNNWLFVSGGILSSIIIEIYKNPDGFIPSALFIIFFTSLFWGASQYFFSSLNYELLISTKNLNLWWVWYSKRGAFIDVDQV